MQPENGGYSVFAHEYAHDLGLPDEYDTAGGDNGVNWWTLMAQSRVSAPQDQAIGTRAADLGAWDKLQLGWLDYEVVGPGQSRRSTSARTSTTAPRPRAWSQVLPKKRVTLNFGAPAAGTNQWWSGTDDDYEATLARGRSRSRRDDDAVVHGPLEHRGLRPGRVRLRLRGGQRRHAATSRSRARSPTPPRATASTGSSGYKPATFDLSAYAGKTVSLRFLYAPTRPQQGNPGATMLPGIFSSTRSSSPTARRPCSPTAPRTAPTAGPPTASRSSARRATTDYDTYYVASNRTYTSFDRYLQSGPYNFGFPDRPGLGRALPVPERPARLLLGHLVLATTTRASIRARARSCRSTPTRRRSTGSTASRGAGAIQTYDAPFGLEKSDSLTLHAQETGAASYIRGQAGQPLFDDRREYWDPALPNVGVKVPHVGVTIRVAQQSGTSMRIRVGSVGRAGT